VRKGIIVELSYLSCRYVSAFLEPSTLSTGSSAASKRGLVHISPTTLSELREQEAIATKSCNFFWGNILLNIGDRDSNHWWRRAKELEGKNRISVELAGSRKGMIFSASRYDRTPGCGCAGQAPDHTFVGAGKV
jgi:hypothetical protein